MDSRIACFFLGILFLVCVCVYEVKSDECIIIEAPQSYFKKEGESYIDIGKYKIPEKISSDDRKIAEISFEVLIDRVQHDGILFAVGNSPNFKYYEWKKKAVNTVFMVVEFVYSSMSVLLKALNQPYMEQIEIYRTYPQPYNISDGQWHSIFVSQEDGMWTLKFDNITVRTHVSEKNDINLIDKDVYIGGRPGYFYCQFRGIIKNLTINRRKVFAADKAKTGRINVTDCNSPETKAFAQLITRSPFYHQNRRRGKGQKKTSSSRRQRKPQR